MRSPKDASNMGLKRRCLTTVPVHLVVEHFPKVSERCRFRDRKVRRGSLWWVCLWRQVEVACDTGPGTGPHPD